SRSRSRVTACPRGETSRGHGETGSATAASRESRTRSRPDFLGLRPRRRVEWIRCLPRRRVSSRSAGPFALAAGSARPEFDMAKTRVHRILEEVGSLAFPGVFDTLSAKIAERAGFPMAFVSGYSVAATAIGEPDLGLLTQTEMIDRARRICMSVQIPIIVDA